MKKLIMFAIVCLFCGAANAGMRADRIDHMYIGAIAGATGDLVTGNAKIGMLTACVLGAAKEGWDARGNGTADFADFGYTCAAGALAAVGVHWLYFDVVGGTPLFGYKVQW